MGAKGFIIIGATTAAAFVAFWLIFLGTENKEAPLPATCANGAAHPALVASHNPTLKKLAEYEQLCKGSVVDSLMVFAAMPTSQESATAQATAMADILNEFSRFGIAPLVVFEPSFSSPTIISDSKNGMYDQALKAYFLALKSSGISSEQMGTWVLFPEANTPIWHNTNPSDFTANVTKVARLQKEFFPTSKTSILLNSRSHPSDDTSWSRGELKSLVPYVENIPAGTIDSVGLQGFPYKAPQNEPPAQRLAASEFLPAHLAKEMASALHIKNIWLNTGTFSRMYTGDEKTEARLSSDERSTILTDILSEVAKLQKENFTVQLNLFAQDKSRLAERVDWSYWPSTNQPTGPDAEVLELFLRRVRQQNLQFSLYDTA